MFFEMFVWTTCFSAVHLDGDGAEVSHLMDGILVAEVMVREVGNEDTKIVVIAVEGKAEEVTVVEVLLNVLIFPGDAAKEAMVVGLRIQRSQSNLPMKGDMRGVEVVEDEAAGKSIAKKVTTVVVSMVVAVVNLAGAKIYHVHEEGGSLTIVRRKFTKKNRGNPWRRCLEHNLKPRQ